MLTTDSAVRAPLSCWCGILTRAHRCSSYDDSRVEQMADRLAPLVAERGFDSFLDYYYMLK